MEKVPPKDGKKRDGKQVGKLTFNWCNQDMAWTVHKPSNCTLGHKHKDDQKKGINNKANSAVLHPWPPPPSTIVIRLPIAPWARSTRTTRRKATTTKPTLLCCILGHHHPQQSLRCPIGHACNHEPQSVMVRTSMHVEFIVSMCGWAIIHGSRNFDLPILQHPTNLHHHPTSPCLSHQDPGNGDHQIGSLASLGETSHHSMHKNQKIQDSSEKSPSQKQDKWSNHTNLPFSGALRRLQGWLLHQRFSPMLLRSVHLDPLPSGLPEQGDAPTHIPTGQIQF